MTHIDTDKLGGRMLDMIMVPMELVVTDADKKAACDLLGTDTYGKPYFTVETINGSHRTVNAFAKHRTSAILAMAEENERLSALARANNDLARHEANGRRELQAENALLREALDNIANESSDSWARDLARQALAAPGEHPCS